MLRQLFQKEIRLQKSNLYFVLAIILAWGILLALATRAEVKLGGRPDVTMGLVVCLLQVGFVGFCLLVVAPLLVGAAMVAEERKLGVWEWQLSLPCPRRTQWAVKLAVGSAITLALTLVVQPLLDFLLSRVLGSYAHGILLPSALLRGNEIYRTIPLLLMMSAAFVSSMSRDPYKAFFLGIVFFGFVAVCFSILDPAHLLITSWNLGERLGMGGGLNTARFLVNKQVPWMLGLGLCAGLGALAWFNFRLEGFRWRRFVGQLASVFLLAVAATWIGLHLEFGIGGLVSQKTRDVEPLILRNRSQAPGAGKTVDWAGIAPVLVRRAELPPRASKLLALREERCWEGACPSRVIRIPRTGRILAEIYSFPVWEGQLYRPKPLPQVVELGIDKRCLRPILSLSGHVMQVFPEDSVYVIGPPLYYVTRWPIPLELGGLLSRKFVSGRPFKDPFWELQEMGQPLKVDGKPIRVGGVNPVNSEKGYWDIVVLNKTGQSKEEQNASSGKDYSMWLIKKGANNDWSLVNKQEGFVHHAVSSDGKWYARQRHTFSAFPTATVSSLGVYSCDHTTSWTIVGSGGDVILCNAGWQEYNERQDMGVNKAGILRVSPSGRFLPFLRTKITIKLEVDGKELDTHYPEVVEFALLNLQTGQESALLHTQPDGASQQEFQEVMKQWNLWKSRRESGQTGKEETFHQEGSLVTFTGRNVPLYYQKFPPLLWAPDRDALAILFDERIYLFERRAQTAETAGKQVAIPENAARQASGQKPEQTAAQETGQTAAQETGQKAGQESAGQEPAGQKTAGQEPAQNAGDFHLLGAVDLTGFQIRDMDFWNGGVMLAWGGTGLYRIDLANALKPAPPEQ